MKTIGFILLFFSFNTFAERVSKDVIQTLKIQCQLDSDCEIEYYNKVQNQQRPVKQFMISNGSNTLYVYESGAYVEVSSSLEEQIRTLQNIQQPQNN